MIRPDLDLDYLRSIMSCVDDEWLSDPAHVAQQDQSRANDREWAGEDPRSLFESAIDTVLVARSKFIRDCGAALTAERVDGFLVVALAQILELVDMMPRAALTDERDPF